MTRPMPPSPTPPCRILTTTSNGPISVYPRVYRSASEILQNQHSCGLQPYFGEQVQNIG